MNKIMKHLEDLEGVVKAKPERGAQTPDSETGAVATEAKSATNMKIVELLTQANKKAQGEEAPTFDVVALTALLAKRVTDCKYSGRTISLKPTHYKPPKGGFFSSREKLGLIPVLCSALRCCPNYYLKQCNTDSPDARCVPQDNTFSQDTSSMYRVASRFCYATA